MRRSLNFLIFVIGLSLNLYSQDVQSPCEQGNPLKFLIGKWEYVEYFLNEGDTTLHGKSQFTIDDFYGCGVHEKWDGTDAAGVPNFKAISTITFNEEARIWVLHTVRRFETGNVNLEEWKGKEMGENWRFIFERTSRGQIRLIRVTSQKPNAQSFHSLIEVSTDFGETWNSIAFGKYIKL